LRAILKSRKLKVAAIVAKKEKCAVAEIARAENLPLFCDDLNLQFAEKMRELKPAIFAVVDFGKFLPNEILAIPKFGAFNLHPSLLPKFRGPTPVQSAILAGEKKSGFSIFKIGEKMDAGEIFFREEIEIENLRADEVYEKILKIAAPKFCEILEKIAAGEISTGEKQNEKLATFCGKIEKSHGEIFPQKETAEEILRKINAFFPWPSAFLNSEKFGFLKILRGKKIPVNSGLKPAVH